MADGLRRLVELSREESLDRLASVPFGRIVFTRQAMPAIRPVNHIVDNGAVIVRTHLGAAILSNLGVVVAYEADDIDSQAQLGWSVVVTGFACLVKDPSETAHYERLLRPWVNGNLDQVIRIQPEYVTGYRITADG